MTAGRFRRWAGDAKSGGAVRTEVEDDNSSNWNGWLR